MTHLKGSLNIFQTVNGHLSLTVNKWTKMWIRILGEIVGVTFDDSLSLNAKK